MEKTEVKKRILDLFPQNPLCEFEFIHCADIPVCALELRVRDSEILLNNIRVLDGQENKGHATNAIKLLIQIAESSKYIISGTVESNGRKLLNNKKLKSWYKSLGFTINGNDISYYPSF